jgi:disulfide bond formation protein DsbB
MTKIQFKTIAVYLLIALASIFVHFIAFFFQLAYNELPCPLCLLQRFGFLATAFGAILSIFRGNSWKYDLIIIASSVYTLLAGFRQVLLHILPNNAGYGSTFLGLHFYTWSVVASFVFIVLMAIRPFIEIVAAKLWQDLSCSASSLSVLKTVFILVIVANIISTYLECGFSQCLDDPVFYIELEDS